MPKVRYIRYYIGDRPINRLASSLTRAEIANHIKYDHGEIYTVDSPQLSRIRRKTRQKNAPIPIAAHQPPVQHHLQQSVYQRPKPLDQLRPKPPVKLEPKPIFKCIGCGKELHPLYGQEPGIMCGECFYNS